MSLFLQPDMQSELLGLQGLLLVVRAFANSVCWGLCSQLRALEGHLSGSTRDPASCRLLANTRLPCWPPVSCQHQGSKSLQLKHQ